MGSSKNSAALTHSTGFNCSRIRFDGTISVSVSVSLASLLQGVDQQAIVSRNKNACLCSRKPGIDQGNRYLDTARLWSFVHASS